MKKPIRRADAKPHPFDDDDNSPSGNWADTFREVRVWLLAMALIAFLIVLIAPEIKAATGEAAIGEAAGLERQGEVVEGTFAPCGPRADSLCVVDGDTFRIHARRVRVVGIDTAERTARCEAEAALAARSTEALRNWLNRGPFVMTPNSARAVDRYGRELQVVTRVGADGRVEALADWMRAEGGAREYGGGTRGGWC